MAVGVNQPNMQRQDPLDQVVKGLQIATSIYGIKADMAKVDLAKQDQKMKQDAAARETTTFQQGQDATTRKTSGQILPADAAALTKDHTISETPMPGAQKLTVLDPAGNRDIWVAPASTKSKSPLEDAKTQAEIAKLKAETDKAREEKVPKTTADQAKAATFSKRMEQSEAILEGLNDKGFAGTDVSTGVQQSKFFPERFKSEDVKSLNQAKSNFINAVLRRESGAAISAGEFEQGEKQYFPAAGDSPGIIEQKRQNRLLALESLKTEAGGAFGKVNFNTAPASKSPLQEAVSKNKPPAFTPQDLNSMSDSDLAAIHSQVVKKGKK